jgi:transaldolase
MARTATGESFKSPLHEMTQTTPTCLWNDSASIQELTYSIEHGAVGATCNPVIVVGVLNKEMLQWKDRIQALIRDWPTATEDEIAWQLVREISCKSAALLKPIFDAQRGRNGRLSIQTDPRFFRDTESIAMGPVCTIMVGRLDDWLKVAAEKENIAIDPGYLEWAGVAVFKKTYQIFRKRGYRIRLLSAAFRNHMHWSEFIGGDVVISPPNAWQVRFNASDIEVQSRIDKPVESRILEELTKKFADFRHANEEEGLRPDEFDAFPPTRRTLRQFIAACHDLDGIVRDVLIPNPDAA